MTEQPVIVVDNLSKCYRIGHARPQSTLRDTIATSAKRLWNLDFGWRTKKQPDTFWALKDISFSVPKGEVLGIIGRNGAGKSTLLKVISRITEPSTGRVHLKGRVSSLLEVGTGFHPELSGRENILLNGAILGMTRNEILRKFDEIVAFAEVEQFLDTPVKHYSSGMYVRLAFAVAAHLEPEILIIDEVLAVGDAQFQEKCLGKMRSVAKQEGRTVLFVSHNTSAIQNLCHRVIVLDKGSLSFNGSVTDGLQFYLNASTQHDKQIVAHQNVLPGSPVCCTAIKVDGCTSDHLALIDTRNPLDIEIRVRITSPCRISLESYLSDGFGYRLAFASPGHDESNAHVHSLDPGDHTLRATLILPPLIKGHYQLAFSLVQPFVCKYVDFPAALSLAIDGSGTSWGRLFENAPTPPGFQIMKGSVAVERAT